MRFGGMWVQCAAETLGVNNRGLVARYRSSEASGMKWTAPDASARGKRETAVLGSQFFLIYISARRRSPGLSLGRARCYHQFFRLLPRSPLQPSLPQPTPTVSTVGYGHCSRRTPSPTSLYVRSRMLARIQICEEIRALLKLMDDVWHSRSIEPRFVGWC